MPETPGYVVLKHKDSSIGHYAAVVPEGTPVEDVIEAWKPFGWQRGAKTELDELLNTPTVDPDDRPAEPDNTTTKEK
jgi:hypothetical protein